MTDYRALKDINYTNFDRFIPLHTKRLVVEKESASWSGKILDIGCGRMPYKSLVCQNRSITEYRGIDIKNEEYQTNESQPDDFWDGKTLPYEDYSYDVVILTEVLEHIANTNEVLLEINRVLKPGGKLFFTIPFVWNLHDIPNDEYRFTPFALRRHFATTNFNESLIYAFGGWHMTLAVLLAAWYKRSNKNWFVRYLPFILIKTIVVFLYKNDREKNTTNFKEGFISFGYWGYAIKGLIKSKAD